MKRAGNLYQRIADPDNLRLAFMKAARGKQKNSEVLQFRLQFEKNIEHLSCRLQNRKVDIGKYHFFHVKDPKQRLICAASFDERVLHHAIMNVCEPVFERYAIFDSYACRVGKGLRRAIQRCRLFSRRSNWFLKLDINKYFDSIDHARMIMLLSKRFKDKTVLDLFTKLLATYCVDPGKGVPIGNLISQHLANFYLGHMDHWLKEERRVKGFLRYMDDFVIFGKSRDELKDEYFEVKNFLQDFLHLHIKNNWSLNRCVCGIPFLGFRILPSTVRLGRRSEKRFIEKLLLYEKRFSSGNWSEDKLCRHVTPLIEFTRNGDSFSFRKNILQRTRVEF